MSSYTADTAEAIKDTINAPASGEDFSQEFTAIRVYTPHRKYEDVVALEVTVFARAVDRTRETRADIRKEIEVDITIAKRISQTCDPSATGGNTEIDEMMEFCEEVADFIADPSRSYSGSKCLRVEADPIFDFEYLRTHRVFIGLLKAFCIRL